MERLVLGDLSGSGDLSQVTLEFNYHPQCVDGCICSASLVKLIAFRENLTERFLYIRRQRTSIVKQRI